MSVTLLTVLLLPIVAVPFIYLVGRKSAKYAAALLAAIALSTLGLILTTVPTILSSGNVIESYAWIQALNSEFTLSVDGISVSMAIVTMVLMLAAAIYSINYMEGKKNLPVYYALLSLLFVGLVGVFLTSNLLFFYFCWELMLVPAYFIIGGWGYRDSYKAAFKFFVFTHAGAVFVLLGIGAIYMTTGTTNFGDAQTALVNFPDAARWILLALTAGFAVKMAIVPVHMWLPDAHGEAPTPLSAILSGVIISAGAYAILRLSLGLVFPAVANTTFGVDFLHGLAVFGVLSAFFGGFIALAETDIKRVIAYSSMAHMGYILFGLALFPVEVAITGTVLHIVAHAFSKGLLFFSAGSVMHSLHIRNIKEMGGLAKRMPFSGTFATIAALSIGGAPPFACFISEFFIFMGAFQLMATDSFFMIPTALMLIATVLSLGYSLRFVSTVFLGVSKVPEEKKKLEVPQYMIVAMALIAVLVVIVGIYPSFFIDLIKTATSHLI
jgi:NADH-quinone oxidoreductase subunit M